MKTKFTTFGGGLITGLLLMLLVSATTKESVDPVTDPTVKSDDGSQEGSQFHLVPIDDFYQNVARYRCQHVDKVRRVTQKAGQEEPSRMFIYFVSTIESFITEVKAAAAEADLTDDQLAIRFYYGVYPRNQRIAGHNYGRLHTLFLVPNYWSQDDREYRDLEILGLAKAIKAFKKKNNGVIDPESKKKLMTEHFLQNIHKTQPRKGVLMLDASACPWNSHTPSESASIRLSDPFVWNQGQLCPPNCPEVSLLKDIDAEYPGYVD